MSATRSLSGCRGKSDNSRMSHFGSDRPNADIQCTAFQGSPLSRPKNTIAFTPDFGVRLRARWPKSPIRAARYATLEKRLSI